MYFFLIGKKSKHAKKMHQILRHVNRQPLHGEIVKYS